MTDDRLGDASIRLLETLLGSFEKLELLRIVRANTPGVFEPEAVAAMLRIDGVELVHIIDELVAADLARRAGGTLVLGPRATAQDVVELMAIYQRDQVLVVTTLSSLVVGRLRNMAASAFADAFVLTKRGRRDDG